MATIIGTGWSDLLMPRACPICEAALIERHIDICTQCALSATKLVGHEHCASCGLSVGPFILKDDRCPACQNKRPPHDRLIRVSAYEGIIQAAILRYKAGGRAMLGQILGKMLADAAMSLRADLVTTIPSHWTRRITRTYQPSRLIAQTLADTMGLPFEAVLKATRRTREQKRLPASQRAANVKGAFAVPSSLRLDGLSVCLVDDVLTSGETMREAARVLRNAGAEIVFAAVVAVSEPNRERPDG